MKNIKSACHLLLVMFICLSCLVYSISAVPTSRVLLKSYKDTPALQDFQAQIAMEGEMSVVEGRMDFESTDYPGTGANNRHDPKTPGTI